MTVTYRSPLRQPERILAYGPQGAGKSHNALVIASKLPDAKFRVIDIDYSPSYERLIDLDFPQLGEDRVEVVTPDPEDWTEILDAVIEAVKETGPGDWLVIDSITHTWPAVQGWFIQNIYGEDPWEYFLDVRQEKEKQKAKGGKDAKSLGALEGWMDWPVINKQYFRLYRQISKCRGHVYISAESTSIGSDDDREVRDRFGAYGSRPNGQKRIGFVPHTVLLLKKSRVGEYTVSTVKDRGREELEDEEIGDFFRDYMVKVAGWKMART